MGYATIAMLAGFVVGTAIAAIHLYNQEKEYARKARAAITIERLPWR